VPGERYVALLLKWKEVGLLLWKQWAVVISYPEARLGWLNPQNKPGIIQDISVDFSAEIVYNILILNNKGAT
tara:strand:- start:752 stop:967 length:216 start_codon:yes stop_codon:yes gene_type:complete